MAGGYSRRMGQDKALLTLCDGQPLISRTAQVAQSLSTEVLIVTPWPERYRAIVSDSVRLIAESHSLPNSATCDQKLSDGPLSGFVAGWQHLSTDWCLLLACDLPQLETSVLQEWWAWIIAQSAFGWPQLEQAPSSQKPSVQTLLAVQPMASLTPMAKAAGGHRIGWEPICGYYHRSCLPSLEQQHLERRRAFQPWLSALRIARYEAVPPKMLFNCNTQADWIAAKDL